MTLGRNPLDITNPQSDDTTPVSIDPTLLDNVPLAARSDPFLQPLGQQFEAVAALHVGKSAAQPMALYLTEPGDTTAISVHDINQGGLGDCYLLSSIGEMALYAPGLIQNMIKANSNGTESVSLFGSANGKPPGFLASSFVKTSQTVTNAFPSNSVNSGATQDVVNGIKEIWVQVLEAAYAQANGGYNVIGNGGNPCIAMQELTGHTANWYSPASITAATLSTDVSAKDLIVMDTASTGGLGYGLVNNHAYMFEGIQTVNGAASVQLGNPWGYDQPSLIPVSQLSKAGIVEVDVGRTH